MLHLRKQSPVKPRRFSKMKKSTVRLFFFPALQVLIISIICYLGIITLNKITLVIFLSLISLDLFFLLSFLKNHIEIYANLRHNLERILARETISIEDDCILSSEINSLLLNMTEIGSQRQQEVIDKELHLRFLMSQINPHFLYNTLESIRGQAIQNDDLIVAEMTETLSIFFRYCVSRKGTLVSIDDEIKNVKVYMKIMKFRLTDKFKFDIILDDDLESKLNEYQIPKLTLQPIIENAIIHGIHGYKAGGKIKLRIELLLDSIRIYIRDNGVGIIREELDRINSNLNTRWAQNENISSGLALSNINRRIKLAFGEMYGLHIFSIRKVGTNVIIHIPRVSIEVNASK